MDEAVGQETEHRHASGNAHGGHVDEPVGQETEHRHASGNAQGGHVDEPVGQETKHRHASGNAHGGHVDEPVGQETEHKDTRQGTRTAGTWTNRSARKLSTMTRIRERTRWARGRTGRPGN